MRERYRERQWKKIENKEKSKHNSFFRKCDVIKNYILFTN